MHEQPKPSKDLREISHLFLSSVREHANNGSPRPQRKGPQARRDMSIDLTPEELAMAFQQTDLQVPDMATPARSVQVRALVASHLNGSQGQRIAEYARHLAGMHGRVAMIRIDGSEFRLSCFEASDELKEMEAAGDAEDSFDPQRAAEAMDELGCDVDCWLVSLPNLAAAEARTLLGKIKHWVLLSTCDSDGVVSSYRTLKGLAAVERERLSLALLEAQDEMEADRVARRLTSVSDQFLHCPIETEPVVKAESGAVEAVILQCRLSAEQEQSGVHWSAVAQFLSQHQSAAKAPAAAETPRRVVEQPMKDEETPDFVADLVIPARATAKAEAPVEAVEEPVAEAAVQQPRMAAILPASEEAEMSDVLDLPEGQADEASILSAIMGQTPGNLVDCPVRPPMCPQARLAISRDRKIVLMAVAKQGLSDLRPIAQAYRWLVENRSLISMAVPQFAIEAMALPQLTLLVDHADASAELLQPLVHAGHVTVRSYRKLRWGRKTGLLLDAA